MDKTSILILLVVMGTRLSNIRGLYRKGFGHLLYLLCIFVANENDNWVYLNAVKPFNGMGCNVEQTVAVLRNKITEQRATSV